MTDRPYDPRDHGSLCDRCPLGPVPGQPWAFVPPEPGSAVEAGRRKLLIVLESPGKTEVEQRRPAVGKSGRLLFDVLGKAGVSRGQVAVTNTTLCRCPGDGDLDIYEKLHARKQRKRKDDGLEPQPGPVECCRPRLEKELAQAPYILALGSFAARAVFGSEFSVMKEAGAPGVYLDPAGGRTPALATVHPAFVLRTMRMMRMFRAHVRRAVNRSEGVIEWVEPKQIVAPSPATLWNWLQAERSALPEARARRPRRPRARRTQARTSSRARGRRRGSDRSERP